MLNLENNHPSRASISSHSLTSKFLHWGFTLLYAYGIVKQVNDISQLEDASLLEFEVIFAIVFLAIVILRYFYMRRFPTLIGAPENISKVYLLFARSIHVGMYFSLIMLPVSGLVIAFLFSLGFKDGLLQALAMGLHDFSASLSYWLIGIHILAAVYSRLKGEKIWHGMVPFWNEERTVKIPDRFVKIESFTFSALEKILHLRGKKNVRL
ncbi:MAG: cytochrome b/b6 domain-containing protein [SAR324 cluster bacterium]|jgi:cytochrome b561|nr:cytochrome b/b6 domain-containing protein [SAR324 cluster bacterium]